MSDQWLLVNAPSSPSQAEALGVLQHIGTNLVPHLLARLESGQPHVAIPVIAGFEALGPLGKDAVPRLIQIFMEDEPIKGMAARASLGKIGLAAFGAGPAIKERFLNGVVIASVTLAEIGYVDDEIMDHCIAILHSDQPTWHKQHVATALGKMGSRAFPAVDALLSLLEQPKRDTYEILLQLHVFEALGSVGDARAIPTLVRLLNDNVDSGNLGALAFRRSSSKAIAHFGPRATESEAALKQIVNHPKTGDEDKAFALEALVLITGKGL